MDIIRALLSRSGSPGEENNRGRVTTSATYCSLRHSVELRNPPDNDDYVQDNGDTRDKNHADKDSDGQLRSDITQTRTTVDDDVTSILSIPDEILCCIMKNLDYQTICALGKTCRRLNTVCKDHNIWTRLLEKDGTEWRSIGNENHPHTYPHIKDAKALYLACSPELRKTRQQNNAKYIFNCIYNSIADKFRKPRIMIFGDGLDISGIVGGIVSKRFHGFHLHSMFSGEFSGLGSGLNITMDTAEGKLNFDLVTVFTSSKYNRMRNGWINGNTRLFKSSDPKSEPTDRLQLLTYTVDMFIYVNDYESSKLIAVKNSERLHSLCDNRWTKPDCSIAVINIGQECKAMTLCNDLNMSGFNDKRWKVLNNESSYVSLTECLMWYKER